MIDSKGRDALRYLSSNQEGLEKFSKELFSFLQENKKLLPLLKEFFRDNYTIISDETRNNIDSRLSQLISNIDNLLYSRYSYQDFVEELENIRGLQQSLNDGAA